MISDEKLARLLIDTINTLPIVAGASTRAECFPLYAALIETTADTICDNVGADQTIEVLAAVIARLAPQSQKVQDAVKAAQQLRDAQRGQFDA